MIRKNLFRFFIFSFCLGQNQPQYIDGVAVIVENHIILKSDLAQMVNMTAIQSRIDPQLEPDVFMELQNSVIQSMIDQKIMLEMAELDSIVVDEKEVNQALDQQIQMLVMQAGGEDKAEAALGQPIKDFRREFWYDMQDRMISERYQQQLLNNVFVTRSDVKTFYNTHKDSLPYLPMKAKVRHLLVSVQPSDSTKEKTKSFLRSLKSKIERGENFEELAQKFSVDPGSKNNGGNLGWVKRGSLVKSFETEAFTIGLGKISDPIETDFGFHILETLEKQGDKIRVRHILISAEITQADTENAFNFAKTLKDSATNIDHFKRLVSSYSADESTKNIGGDLGWIDPANYTVPEIGQAIKYIDLDSCSPPINSSIGFHLLWVDGLKKGGRPNLLDHWPDVENMALNKKKMDWYNKWIADARDKFHIHILEN